MGRLEDILARGVVTAADGTKKMREVQVTLIADEIRGDLEHIEPYGYTAEPLKDGKPEAFALFFGGNRQHGLVFCVADRRYRLQIEAGEVALYDHLGQRVHLARGGIEVVSKGYLKATVAKDLEATIGGSATTSVSGSLTATVSGSADVTANEGMNITAPTVTINGNLVLNGSLTSNAGSGGGSGAKITGDVIADGISLKSHVHSCGDHDTGAPK